MIYSPNGRFLVQETFPKTLPRFVLILIYRSTERQRNQAFCVTAADWSTITLHDSASKQRWFDYHNQHESAVLIGLFHAASLVLPPVESYRNFRKPSHRGVQGYLSSLQQRVGLILYSWISIHVKIIIFPIDDISYCNEDFILYLGDYITSQSNKQLRDLYVSGTHAYFSHYK